jgi:hypothetical protein
MIQLVKISHGTTQIIIKDCLTDKRGNEFLAIHNEENSFPLLIKFELVQTNNNVNLTYEELERRQKLRKVC